MVAYELDEFLAAARNAQVDISHGIEHLASSLVGGWQQGGNGRVDAVVLQDIVDEADDGAVAVVGVLATFQHTGITALETQREHVERDIGPGLVDHADDSEGYRHSSQAQSVGQGGLLQRLSQRTGQRSHLPHIIGNAFQTGWRELQTVVQRIRRLHESQVFGIGFQQ